MEAYMSMLFLSIISFSIGLITASLIYKTKRINGEIIVDDIDVHKELYLNLSYEELEKLTETEYAVIRVIRRKN